MCLLARLALARRAQSRVAVQRRENQRPRAETTLTSSVAYTPQRLLLPLALRTPLIRTSTPLQCHFKVTDCKTHVLPKLGDVGAIGNRNNDCSCPPESKYDLQGALRRNAEIKFSGSVRCSLRHGIAFAKQTHRNSTHSLVRPCGVQELAHQDH